MIRSIDQDKCIGCGTCQKTCPLDVFRVQTDPALTSSCVAACPIHNDIRQYHRLLQLGSVEEASRLMWRNNPLAAVTGRVCPHFCESKCARGEVDSAVNIASIERFLGDCALEQPEAFPKASHVFPVAVVGSGPAGLACAAELLQQGFRVSVYEARDEPGGMLRYGIPEYRLPPAILAKTMEKLRASGLSFICGKRLGRDFSVESLRNEGYGAIFLAIGAGVAHTVPVEGREGEGILYGLDFLAGVRTRAIRKAPGNVLVVGGGDVAMDVAQSLVRLGASSVRVVSLEAEGELPAFRHNIDDAAGLGVTFEHAASVRKICREDGAITGAELVACTQVFDREGRFAPCLNPDVAWTVSADMVIFAIGQACDVTGVPAEALFKQKGVAAHPVTGQTSVPYLFAAGDAVTGPNSVASAVAGGQRAARAIALYLRGGDLGTITAWDVPVACALDHPGDHRKQGRQEGKTCPVNIGECRFSELHQGLALHEALAEANRCLTCGGTASIAHPDDCMTCFTCELNCPTQAIFVSPIKEDWPRALAPLPKE